LDLPEIRNAGDIGDAMAALIGADARGEITAREALCDKSSSASPKWSPTG
jgi:hypothetical protein